MYKTEYIGGPLDGTIGPALSTVDDGSYWPQQVMTPTAIEPYLFIYNYRNSSDSENLVKYSFVGLTSNRADYKRLS